MSEADVTTEVDLNELYDQEIPCKRCKKPAALRSFGHGLCEADRYPIHCCIGCWQQWIAKHLQIIARHGHITCRYCRRRFDSIESFSDYRPF